MKERETVGDSETKNRWNGKRRRKENIRRGSRRGIGETKTTARKEKGKNESKTTRVIQYKRNSFNLTLNECPSVLTCGCV